MIFDGLYNYNLICVLFDFVGGVDCYFCGFVGGFRFELIGIDAWLGLKSSCHYQLSLLRLSKSNVLHNWFALDSNGL